MLVSIFLALLFGIVFLCCDWLDETEKSPFVCLCTLLNPFLINRKGKGFALGRSINLLGQSNRFLCIACLCYFDAVLWKAAI